MHTFSTESLTFKEQGEVEEKGISVREYVKQHPGGTLALEVFQLHLILNKTQRYIYLCN